MTKHAATLSPSQFRHLRVTEATSRHPERDAVVLLLGHSCGLRITETARLTVADVLMPSGQFRSEVSLRAEITKGCRQRLAYLTHPKLVAALERYITWRKAKRFGCSLDDPRWRGLMPKTKLIVSWKGHGYELSCKRRINVDGCQVDYWACDSLLMRTSLLAQPMREPAFIFARELRVRECVERCNDMYHHHKLLAIPCMWMYAKYQDAVVPFRSAFHGAVGSGTD